MSKFINPSNFIEKLPPNVAKSVTRAGMKVSKHSPTILFGAGVIGFGATVYLASRSTLKVGEVFETYRSNEADINEIYDNDDPDLNEKLKEVYTEEDMKRDRVVNMSKLIFSITKLYAPAILVGGATLACFTGAHVTLSNRYTASVAAYSVLSDAFDRYQERVSETYGEETAREFRMDTVKEKVKTDDGKTETVKVADGSKTPSQYARFFDELNPNWQPDASLNRLFLSNIQNMMNERLVLRGHVFLNEVYDALGIERTSSGTVVGWVLSNDGSDNFIDFGIFDADDVMRRMFVNGDERSVLLDFNVNGLIWDRI